MATMYDPPHLGELIRESIEAEGWSVTETARRLGIGRVALSRVNGHAGVSAALALERIGWSDAEHWMRMQAWDAAAGEPLVGRQGPVNARAGGTEHPVTGHARPRVDHHSMARYPHHRGMMVWRCSTMNG